MLRRRCTVSSITASVTRVLSRGKQACSFFYELLLINRGPAVPNPAPADLNKLNLRPRSVGEHTAAQEFVLVIKSYNSWRDFFELLC